MLTRTHLERIEIAFDDHHLRTMLGCSFRCPSPGTWVRVNSSTTLLTYGVSSIWRRGGKLLEMEREWKVGVWWQRTDAMI